MNYKELTTDLFIEYLRSQRLASNVDLGEVQEVDLKDLKGVDDVLRSLEINIVLPLQLAGKRPDKSQIRNVVDRVGLSERLGPRTVSRLGGTRHGKVR